MIIVINSNIVFTASLSSSQLIDKLNTDTELGTIMADYDTVCS